MRRVVFFIVDRANYGRLLPVLWEANKSPDLAVSLVLGGSFILRRFGRPWEMLEADGLDHLVESRVLCEIEGNRGESVARSCGTAIDAFSQELGRIGPDLAVVIGDRYQMLAAAAACHFMGIPMLHIQGGEHTGHNDDRTRHAITKLAQYHAPATRMAAESLQQMGESESSIVSIGCPSSDLAARMTRQPVPEVLGVIHPDSDDPEWVEVALRVLGQLYAEHDRNDVTILWPNIDAGSDEVSRWLRTNADTRLATLKHLHPVEYLRRIANAAVLVGNSSSFLREAGYFGTPAIITGRRQEGREGHLGVLYSEDGGGLTGMINDVGGKTYRATSPYWAPGVSQEIVRALADVELRTRKERVFYEDRRHRQDLAAIPD